VEAGEIATCDAVVFELLRSERDHTAVAARRDGLAALGPLHHRPFSIVDLLVAAAAELAELPVLHYDRHFELIASVTGQPVRAIAPLGSL
jgi:predicted nucleic acid-binding protein